MKSYYYFKALFVFISILSFVSSCNEKHPEPAPFERTSDAELNHLIKKQVDSLYAVYSRFDYDWINFYEDPYTFIYPNTPINVNRTDSLRKHWKGLYEKYEVKLLDRGEPTIITSEDMAISYNSFNEIFINKQTRDTIKNVGTYIVAWRRQPDDSWKIAFETLHNN